MKKEIFIGDVGDEDVDCGEFRLKFQVQPDGVGFRVFYLGKAAGNHYFYGATEEEALEKAVKAVSVDVSFEEEK